MSESHLEEMASNYRSGPIPPAPDVQLPNLVAFTGDARAGKDEAAKALVSLGYQRSNFGDIIKLQLRDLVCAHIGIDTFTEIGPDKERIRPLLEQWGEVNYENILRRYLVRLPARCVNTRLVRVREAEAWKAKGGVILSVHRPGYHAATKWEFDRLQELKNAGLIDAYVANDRGTGDLHDLVIDQLKRIVAKRQAA